MTDGFRSVLFKPLVRTQMQMVRFCLQSDIIAAFCDFLLGRVKIGSLSQPVERNFPHI